jgi:hypothetical protein
MMMPMEFRQCTSRYLSFKCEKAMGHEGDHGYTEDDRSGGLHVRWKKVHTQWYVRQKAARAAAKHVGVWPKG